MSAKWRDAVFQLFGGTVAIALAFGGAVWAQAVFGGPGALALIASVPIGVITGVLIIKLLHFAYAILVEEK